jgi:hypothetical protein
VFGTKDTNNKFTGVVLGSIGQIDNSSNYTEGLFGYS